MTYILKRTEICDLMPAAFITKNKQRIKQYDDTVYLNDNEQFEIELFNPKKNRIMAKIDINNESIGSGIILRPGERIYLDRFINENKRFLFKTYNIDNSDVIALNAIEYNGNVVISFYDEFKRYNRVNDNLHNEMTTNNTSVLNYSINTTSSNSFNSSVTINQLSASGILSVNNKIETGRVEKGGKSDQSFKYIDTTFENSSFSNVYWKIKPISERIITSDDIKIYCEKCKRKKSNKDLYCGNCGTKY